MCFSESGVIMTVYITNTSISTYLLNNTVLQIDIQVVQYVAIKPTGLLRTG
jgi:hypothetical protein